MILILAINAVLAVLIGVARLLAADKERAAVKLQKNYSSFVTSGGYKFRYRE